MKAFVFTILFSLPLLFLHAEETAEVAEPRPKAEGPSGHPFSWPFLGWEKMEPRGGVTKAPQIELDSRTKESFSAIYEEGLAKKERDRRAILALVGDHRVSFDFMEVAASSDGYQPPRPYFSWATERIFVIQDKADFLSLQHVMVMEYVDKEGQVQGPFVMKHWRQDWSYEDQTLVEYQGERTWSKRNLRKQKGTWVQAVYQVDDSPRYQAVGKWSHEGGMSIFQTQDFWRPLPRREFAIRDDYNVLGGTHQITITPTGWLHTQLNQKLLIKDGKIKKCLATELGAVRYERIKMAAMENATEYWEKTGGFWKTIRLTWAAIEEGDQSFTLQGRVDGEPMYAHLFELAEELEEDPEDEVSLRAEGMAVIGRFLVPKKGMRLEAY